MEFLKIYTVIVLVLAAVMYSLLIRSYILRHIHHRKMKRDAQKIYDNLNEAKRLTKEANKYG